MGRREPSKVIRQGSGRTGEALYGDDTGSVCMGLETGDWQEEATVSLEGKDSGGEWRGDRFEPNLRGSSEGRGESTGQRESQRGLGLGAAVMEPPGPEYSGLVPARVTPLG